MLDAVNVDPKYLGVTLDVGHAKVNSVAWQKFVERFGDRIRVCHLHDNDGSTDQHNPLPEYEPLVEIIPADCFVFEMKTVADVATCVGEDVAPPQSEVSIDD
jgi:sugar phosphate isomerase/epimerase